MSSSTQGNQLPPELVQYWEELTPLQKSYLFHLAIWHTSTPMKKFFYVVLVVIALAVIVWLSSIDWKIALAFGLLLGFLAARLMKR